MERETRANLVFLVVIVALMTPGAVIFVRKKLDPDARPMSLPDSVPHEAAYVDFALQNPGVGRVAPPQTCAWVEELTKRRWRSSAGMPPEEAQKRRGLASEQRRFEIVAVEGGPEGVRRLGVVSWDPEMSINPVLSHFRWGGAAMKLLKFEQIGVPPEVRKELQKLGFVNPPRMVGWYELGPAGAALALAGATLEVEIETPRGPKQDRWRLPDEDVAMKDIGGATTRPAGEPAEGSAR